MITQASMFPQEMQLPPPTLYISQTYSSFSLLPLGSSTYRILFPPYTFKDKKNLSPLLYMFWLNPFWSCHILLACLWNHDPAQCPYIYRDLSHTPHSSTLKMKAIHSSETAVNFYPTIWHHVLKDGTVIFMVFNMTTSEGNLEGS
jgi:hypothetical protein